MKGADQMNDNTQLVQVQIKNADALQKLIRNGIYQSLYAQRLIHEHFLMCLMQRNGTKRKCQ